MSAGGWSWLLASRFVVHKNDSTNDNSYNEANYHHHHAIATAARVRRVLLALARFSLRLLLLNPSLLAIGLARLSSCAVEHMHSRHKMCEGVSVRHKQAYTHLHSVAGTQL